MPHHSNFELNESPLHQKGRNLRMSKAYTKQDFAKPTVLTDDVFPYVTFFYASHGKTMKFINQTNSVKYGNANQFGYEFYWKQAEIFYNATKTLPFEASPVAAYYCMLNAAKSYLAFTSRKSVLDGIMILRSSSMFHWRSLKNLRVIHSRCVLRVGGKRTLNKHPLGGWVLRMGESSFLTKLLVKL